MTIDMLFQILGMVVVAAPAVLLAVLGLPPLVKRPLSELWIGRCTQVAVVAGLLASIAVLILMLVDGSRHVVIEVGDWVIIPQQDFYFRLKFIFDRLSVPFVILTFLLVGTVGAFTNVYLHLEPGYHRFFVFYAVFLLGMIVSSLAGTIETLFAGWELVGLSSALLVAFFQDRPSPVRNGLRVWAIYRVSDAAFLVAAVALHHVTGKGDFDGLLGTGPWPLGHATLSTSDAFFVGMLLLIAAAGKSAMVPFSGWLPRAMEGPTPSSAVFYGALSVHLGAFLLLRISPILELSTPLCVAVVTLGAVTALVAAFATRVQSDIKSALAFASLTQIGIIVVEIGLGLRYIALIHIIGHACLRTLQFLRAPMLLRDYHDLENAIGANVPRKPGVWQKILPPSVRTWFYRFAIERGYLDGLLDLIIIHPFVRVFQLCDRLERKWTDWLAGRPSRESDQIIPTPETLEELK